MACDSAVAGREADTSGRLAETVGHVAFQDGDFGDFATGSIELQHVSRQIAEAFDFARITEMAGMDTAVEPQNVDRRHVLVQQDRGHDAEVEHMLETLSFIDFRNDDGRFLI